MPVDVVLAFCAGAIFGILGAEMFGHHIARVIVKDLTDAVENDDAGDDFF